MQLEEIPAGSETLVRHSFLTVTQDTVRLPDGQAAGRIVVHHPGAACILAETPDGKVVLVRQWRHAAGRALLELPAGKLDAGEDPAGCALRELAEETPYTAQSVELLYAFYTAPGFCNEIIHLFRAVGVAENSTLQPDTDEFVETELLDREAVRTALHNGDIQDAKTLIGLQYWLAAR